ncbi:beta-galactosidase [Antarctobacter heliothermus]|uniref:Beta-galactosidase n=1 Tax=Antarctobacter heliothermus TaxID=74033 RepID=A0A239CX60_9RHOB|nr:beta-galactosidase [Antarctobacter heliothermus]SNS24221.1 beta-galactosidase [Antarctobacter heliothermus]
MKRTLGTCYYPEHWPEDMWEVDAARMAALGLTWVRIGEFGWSVIEPAPGELQFDWLDRAIDTLGRHGLKVVLGTPTATPPRWMLDRHQDMLAVDAEGRARGFGSRRHYCFSHAGYFEESKRITRLLAERYGRNPHVAAWQTDNEYGCHDTILSYSDAARSAFQDWCAQRYQSTDALNRAWGNVFWSMIYDDFEQIGLPNLTVTEPNPAHVMAFRRFSSDQVVRFNRAQVDIIRAHSDAPIAHNYMGRVTEFDHYKVGADLDIATWDSYPLGFLEDRVGRPVEDQRAYARQGDPDFQAFHHDLYRAVGKNGRWWVMEQQPGPVNWAPYNPAPLPGMVRLWTWEAFAHGAEAVCYFRWRQAAMAQEQMHAGLLRPDSVEAPGFGEAQQVAAELTATPEVAPAQAPVGLIFDYEAEWMWAIQPHAKGASYFALVFDTYRALRRVGLDVDILPPQPEALAGYKLILAPGLMHLPDALLTALLASDAQVLLGPRTAARDADFRIPLPLPPALPGLPVTVSRVESLRPDMPEPLRGGGAAQMYLEDLETTADPVLETNSGVPVAVGAEAMIYLGGWLDDTAMDRLTRVLCARADLETFDLPEGVRTRTTAAERFWFNHSSQERQVGRITLPPAGVLRVPLV